MTDETDLKEVSNSIYDALKPLDSENRKRAIHSALALLGETFTFGAGGKPKSGREEEQEEESGDDTGVGLGAAAKRWAAKYQISKGDLQHVFHVDGDRVDVILDHAPGKNDKERAINSYTLAGLAEFLRTGDAKFTDKAARDLCRKLGCYDANNHSVYIKRPGNIFSGSKDAGWMLTGPGQKAAADLVKQIIKE
jgi:hypothetical protein